MSNGKDETIHSRLEVSTFTPSRPSEPAKSISFQMNPRSYSETNTRAPETTESGNAILAVPHRCPRSPRFAGAHERKGSLGCQHPLSGSLELGRIDIFLRVWLRVSLLYFSSYGSYHFSPEKKEESCSERRLVNGRLHGGCRTSERRRGSKSRGVRLLEPL